MMQNDEYECPDFKNYELLDVAAPHKNDIRQKKRHGVPKLLLTSKKSAK